MLWTLSDFWTIVINVLAWLFIHLSVPFIITQFRAERFDPGARLYRKRSWEKDGDLYRNVFWAHKWKRLLPDGAAWFKKGFPKKSLQSRSPAYLQRFVRETCRAELAHYLVMLFAPLFFLWNPAWIGRLMILYALLANGPCIITQRYNRIYFNRLLTQLAEKKGPSDPFKL
jgi:glycosyl-4,4'-diaponeurosporenoate acyltransferase